MNQEKDIRTSAISYEDAVRELASPQTWCKAARALAARGDRRALLPLLDAYESPVEGGKRCLLEAMDELRASDAAADLYDRGDPRQRGQAVRLMELFPGDQHLPRLTRALSDSAEGVRIEARRAIVNQERTQSWKAAMTELLESPDAGIRRLAEESLAR